MSFMDWLQGLFASKNDDDLDDENLEREENSFEVSQHMRIVMALLVVIISGFVMWWILE